jgi:hypothetical protein
VSSRRDIQSHALDTGLLQADTSSISDIQVPIGAVRDTWPPAVGSTLDRLLAATPSDRFPDTAHLVVALSTLPA